MKFSIITCTYNSENFLKKNIRSVAVQTYANYEHIFIDGNSSDNTLEIIEEYKKKTPAKVRIHKTNPKGISNAMNEGIKKASGEFLIHLHSDDSFFDENVLQDVADFLDKNPNLDWIYGKANVINEKGEKVGIFPNRKILQHSHDGWFGKYLVKFFNFIPHQSVLIRKSVFEKFGYFDETIKSKMDPDMWMRIRKKTTWTFMNRIICNYTIRPGAQSSSKKNIQENKKNLEIVQRRYMNSVEFILAKVFNKFISLINKTPQ